MKQSWDKKWQSVFIENEWGKYPAESVIRFVAKNFYKSNRSEIKILEVGCGTGANIWYLLREGFDAYGIDGSSVAIGRARDRLDNENLISQLVCGDIINLPYSDNYFDAVIDNECIYCNNFKNTQLIMNEIQRVLKPNGKFYSRTFTDKLFVGGGVTDHKRISEFEYAEIHVGPLAGKGFTRLTSYDNISKVYGEIFNILQVDSLEYTIENQNQIVSEWIIICEK
jgi:ubiquinone/menaquinone biosynthesis C-methylase UbiE